MSAGAVLDWVADARLWPQFKINFLQTLDFESPILTVLPASLIIAALPIYFLRWYGQPALCRSSYLLWLKVATSIAFICTEFALLAVESNPGETQTQNFTTASSTLLAAVSVSFIIYLEHFHTLRSTATVALWLIFTLSCDIVKARFSFVRTSHTASTLKTLSSAAKLILLCLEEISKRTSFYDEQLKRDASPESTCGFLRRSCLTWLNPLFALGSKDILSADQLDDLGPGFSAQYLSDRLARYWQPRNKSTAQSLIRACFRSLKWEFVSIIFPRLCYSVFKLSQAGLAYFVIDFVETADQSPYKRLALLLGAALIYSCLAISRAKYEHGNYRFGIQLSSTLSVAIYRKSLRISQAEARNAAALSLISTDVKSVLQYVPYFHNLWASILEIGICIYSLSLLLKKSVALVAIPAILTVATGSIVGRYLPAARKAWNKSVQLRVARASSVIAQAKAVKMVGLEQVAGDHLQEARATEIALGKTCRKWIVILLTAGGIFQCITSPLMLGGALYWTKLESGFTPREVYTILAIVALAIGPLGELVDSYTFVKASFACFSRVQDYLTLDERLDFWQDADFAYPPVDEKMTTIDEKYEEGDGEALPRNRVVEMSNLNIYSSRNGLPILRNVSLSLDRHQRILFAGSTGSGKSLLLSTILGETQFVTGSIYVEPGTAGYCGQNPWLQDGTVRDSIIGQSPVDMEWYNTVVDACLLRKDLQRLERSDNTVIGSNGSNLSGGQRHRLALARAVYSRSPYLVLDGVFASLDGNTASSIFDNLFGTGGILERCPMTVLLTAYSSADRIVLIDDDGHVTSKPDLEDSTFKLKVERIINQATGNVRPERPVRNASVTLSALPPDGTTQDTVRQRGDLRLYLFYLRTFQVGILLIWVVLAFLTSFTENFPDAFVNIWLKTDASDHTYFTGYATLSVSCGIFTFLSASLWFFYLVPHSALVLHRKLVDTIMGSNLAFLTSANHGVLVNLFNQDMTVVTQLLAFSFLRTVLYGFRLFIRSSMVLSATLLVAIMIPFLISILVCVQIFYLRTSRQLRHLLIESKSPLNSHLTDTGTGLRYIRSFGWEREYIEKNFALIDASQKPQYYIFAIERWLALITDTLTFFIAFILLAVTLFTERGLSSSDVGLSMVSLISLSDLLMQFIKNLTDLETSMGSIQRVKEFVTTTPQEHGPQKPIEVPQSWPEDGRVVLRNVVAKYTSKSTAPAALNGVTVTIPAGHKVGVIGRTGCGKSSLLLTLLNFLEYTGKIFIDNIDISKVPREVLRSRITTVSQDDIEFDASVRFNLCPWTMSVSPYKGNVNEAAVFNILDGLGLLRLVAKKGLDAKMSELKLSHGQKQLMSIARACLHKLATSSRLVIMDEPTSNLDAVSEEMAQHVMDIAFWDCTVIVVAHRTETLADANIMIKMKDGKIAKQTFPNPKVPEVATPITAPPVIAPVPESLIQMAHEQSIRSLQRHRQTKAAGASGSGL